MLDEGCQRENLKDFEVKDCTPLNPDSGNHLVHIYLTLSPYLGTYIAPIALISGRPLVFNNKNKNSNLSSLCSFAACRRKSLISLSGFVCVCVLVSGQVCCTSTCDVLIKEGLMT